MKPDNGLTYSKRLPIITGSVFIFVILFCLFVGNYELSTIYVTAITVSGGAFTGTIIYYLKKSQTENTYKLDVAAFKEKAKIELAQLEQTFEIKNKYKVSDDDIIQARLESDLDEMVQDSFHKTQNNIDRAQIDAQFDGSEFRQI